MLRALGYHVFLVSKILTLRAQLSGVHVGLGDEGPGWEALRKKLWTSRVRVTDSYLPLQLFGLSQEISLLQAGFPSHRKEILLEPTWGVVALYKIPMRTGCSIWLCLS